MNLTHLHIRNYCGAREIDLALDTPVTLIAGRNGQGKSSIAEGIRHAMLGSAGRVALKKDFAALVSDGEKKGEVNVDSSTADGEAAWRVALPGGKQSGPDLGAALPFVLDPARFAAIDDNQRRTEVLDLAGIAMDAETVAAKLAQRGRAKAHIAALPLDRGLLGAARVALDKASEARGAWKAVTGEAYGSVKAESWQAPRPADRSSELLGMQVRMRELADAVDAAQRAVTVGEEQQRARREALASRAGLEGKAALFARAQDKLQHDEAELARCRQKLAEAEAAAGTKPREGLVHDLARSLALLLDILGSQAPRVASLDRYEAEHGPLATIDGAPATDPTAAAYIATFRQSVSLMETTVANSKRDRDGADAAARALDALGELPAAPTNDELAALRTQLAEAKAAKTAIDREAATIGDDARAARMADSKTADAARHHADVQAWEAIAADLAPDGIQSELLGAALAPLNERLAQHAADTGWPVVTVEHDMRILTGGRPYALLSESERWRCDAMLGEVIAHLSGLRILLLDRMDVLDLPARSQLLGWLGVLAEMAEIDSVILLGTLKALPARLPFGFTAHWVEGGRLAAAREEAKEAA
ncbi:AAA family ATPase [Derxia gummosa]|uniref:AAA family ATPase n=1 Tax=Derxia gummosa DSM 723 TaxID=1121388 RepID=A0A8B6X3L5_9BURK|nr:AAA family ATPase [Derxia gummosa]